MLPDTTQKEWSASFTHFSWLKHKYAFHQIAAATRSSQEIQGTEQNVKSHLRDAVSKIQIVRNSTEQMTVYERQEKKNYFLWDKIKKKEKLFKRLETNWSSAKCVWILNETNQLYKYKRVILIQRHLNQQCILNHLTTLNLKLR